eukprot:gene26749-4324_t
MRRSCAPSTSLRMTSTSRIRSATKRVHLPLHRAISSGRRSVPRILAALDPPLVTAKIRNASTAQQLGFVLDRNWSGLNHIHVSAAFVQLARLVSGKLGEGSTGAHVGGLGQGQQGVYPSHVSLASHPSPGHGVSGKKGGDASLSSVSSLSSMDAGAWAQEASGTPGAPSRAWPKRQLADASPSPVWDSQAPLHSDEALLVLQNLLNLAPRHMDMMDVQGIANTVHSLAVLRHHSPTLLEQLLNVVEPRLDICTPQNLSNLILGVVYLRHTPGRHWMKQYYTAIETNIDLFGPLDVANTFWAFGRLQFKEEQYKLPPGVINCLLAQSYRFMDQYNPHELAISVWGLSRMGFRPGSTWADQFFLAAFHALPSFRASDLSLLIWSVGQLGMTPNEEWSAEFLRRCQMVLEEFTSVQLCQLLDGLTQLRIAPPSEWSSAALTTISSQMHSMEPMYLVNSMRSAARIDADQTRLGNTNNLSPHSGKPNNPKSSNFPSHSGRPDSGNPNDQSSLYANGFDRKIASGMMRNKASRVEEDALGIDMMRNKASWVEEDAHGIDMLRKKASRVEEDALGSDMMYNGASGAEGTRASSRGSASTARATPSIPAGRLGPSQTADSSRPNQTVDSWGPSQTADSLGPSQTADSLGPSQTADSLGPSQTADSFGPSPGMLDGPGSSEGELEQQVSSLESRAGAVQDASSSTDASSVELEQQVSSLGSRTGVVQDASSSTDVSSVELEQQVSTLGSRAGAVQEASSSTAAGSVDAPSWSWRGRWNASKSDASSPGLITVGKRATLSDASSGAPSRVGQLAPLTSMGTMNEVDLCMALHTLAYLRVRPDDSWLLHLLRHLEDRMPLISRQPNLVAMLTWSLRQLRVQPPSGWTQALLQSSAQRLQRGYSKQLAVLLSALATWDMPETEISDKWMARFWWRSLMLMKQESIDPAAMKLMLSALVRMKAKPHATWMEVCHKAINTGMLSCSYSPHQTALVFKSLAMLGNPIPDSLRRSCLAASYSFKDTMTAEDWQRLFWSLMRLKVEVPSEWTTAALSAALPSLRCTADALHLGTMLEAAAKLGGQPDECWMRSWFHASQAQLPNMGGLAQCQLISNLARLRSSDVQHATPSPEWLAAYMDASLANLNSLSDRQLADVVCSLNYFGALPCVEWVQSLVATSRDRRFHDMATELMMVKGVMVMQERLKQREAVEVVAIRR